jgi:hypothetical protein
VKTLVLFLVCLSITAPASSALAQGEPAGAEAAASGAVDRRQVMWRLEMGYRGSFVTNAGYNPFSRDDYFSQFSMAASRTIWAGSGGGLPGRFSFAPGIAWDFGTSSATARGDNASFSMHRLTVPLEGRMHFGSIGHAFVRAAPGVAFQRAEVDDPSSPAPLSKERWLFATDASAGYAWLVWPHGQASDLVARMWLQGDVGYGWVVAEQLSLAPDLPSSDPRRVSGVDLGTLAMQGAFFRVMAAASF